MQVLTLTAAHVLYAMWYAELTKKPSVAQQVSQRLAGRPVQHRAYLREEFNFVTHRHCRAVAEVNDKPYAANFLAVERRNTAVQLASSREARVSSYQGQQPRKFFLS